MAFICKDKKNTNRQIRVQNKIRFEKQKCFPLTLEGGLQIVPTSGGEGVKQKKKKTLYSYKFTDYIFFFKE